MEVAPSLWEQSKTGGGGGGHSCIASLLSYTCILNVCCSSCDSYLIIGDYMLVCYAGGYSLGSTLNLGELHVLIIAVNQSLNECPPTCNPNMLC